MVRSRRPSLLRPTGLTPREVKWAQNVMDLHRMMDVAKTMYVNLMHYDESLLRVALEIVTCSVWPTIHQWDMNWFARENEHDMFSNLVKTMLAKVLKGGQSGAIIDNSESKELQKRLSEAFAARTAIEKQCSLAESQLAVANEQLTSLRSRIGDLEESLGKATAESRRADKDGQDVLSQLQKQLQQARDEAERAREDARKAKEAADRTRDEAKSAKEDARLAKEDARKQAERNANLEQQLADKDKDKYNNRDKEKDTGEGDLADKRRITELEAALKRMNADLKEVQQEHSKCEEKQRVVVARATATQTGSRATASIATGEGDLSRADAATQAKLDDLKDENERLKLALAELQAKLKTMMDEAKLQGCHDLFERLARKAGLTTIARTGDVFDRLYQDASKRIERLETLREKYRSLHKVDIFDGKNLTEAVATRASQDLLEAGRQTSADSMDQALTSYAYASQHVQARTKRSTARSGLLGSNYPDRASQDAFELGQQTSVSSVDQALTSYAYAPQLGPARTKRNAARSNLLGSNYPDVSKRHQQNCRSTVSGSMAGSVSLPQLASTTTGGASGPPLFAHRNSSWANFRE